MPDTKISDEIMQATIAGAHMLGINVTPLNRKFPGYAFWGEKGAAVASAATLTLGDDGDFFHITGTTTITDIDFTTAKDGRHAWLGFDGALTLTHNATTLNLPGGANIVTAAGDRAFVVQDASDNVHVMVYQRAAAPPVIITPWEGYTPTFTGFGTASSVSFFWRRLADTIEIMGKFTSGSSTATEARISLPSGLAVDSTKVPSIRHCGSIIRSAASSIHSYYPMAAGGNAYLTIGNYSDANDGLFSRNGDALFASGNVVSVNATIPISGW